MAKQTILEALQELVELNDWCVLISELFYKVFFPSFFLFLEMIRSMIKIASTCFFWCVGTQV